MSIIYLINAEGGMHTCGTWEEVRPCIYRDGLLHKGFNAYRRQEIFTIRGTKEEWFQLRLDPDSNAHFWKIVYQDAPVVVLLAQMIAEGR